jgi:chaperonin cofactor prefoldin
MEKLNKNMEEITQRVKVMTDTMVDFEKRCDALQTKAEKLLTGVNCETEAPEKGHGFLGIKWGFRKA